LHSINQGVGIKGLTGWVIAEQSFQIRDRTGGTFYSVTGELTRSEIDFDRGVEHGRDGFVFQVCLNSLDWRS
jgi:hypothetical protein